MVYYNNGDAVFLRDALQNRRVVIVKPINVISSGNSV